MTRTVPTGSRSACVSRFGIRDMVGNVSEFPEDWVPEGTARSRGGSYADGPLAGPLLAWTSSPTDEFPNFGFRCAR